MPFLSTSITIFSKHIGFTEKSDIPWYQANASDESFRKDNNGLIYGT